MKGKQTKNIFVTGGVVSGLGKGITAASLGRLLKARGYKVAAQKLDPHIHPLTGRQLQVLRFSLALKFHLATWLCRTGQSRTETAMKLRVPVHPIRQCYTFCQNAQFVCQTIYGRRSVPEEKRA